MEFNHYNFEKGSVITLADIDFVVLLLVSGQVPLGARDDAVAAPRLRAFGVFSCAFRVLLAIGKICSIDRPGTLKTKK